MFFRDPRYRSVLGCKVGLNQIWTITTLRVFNVLRVPEAFCRYLSTPPYATYGRCSAPICLINGHQFSQSIKPNSKKGPCYVFLGDDLPDIAWPFFRVSLYWMRKLLTIEVEFSFCIPGTEKFLGERDLVRSSKIWSLQEKFETNLFVWFLLYVPKGHSHHFSDLNSHK